VNSDPQVVIAGGGPTGVTAAILLGQYGIRTLILDRFQDVYPQPRAVHLDDEVCRILGRIGVADEFAGISIPGAGLRVLSPEHGVLAQFDRPGTAGRNGYPQANMFDQPELERLLRRRLKATPHVTFRGGVEVTQVTTGTDGQPVVTLIDRNSGGIETITTDFLLGCDGANSVVRTSLGATMKNRGFEQRWLVVDIAADRQLDHWGGVHQVCGSTRAATYMQIGPGRYRWEFPLHDGETAGQFQTLASLAELIRPWEADTTGFELVRVTEYTFKAQLADRWRDDRVFLLGDAAHLTPPFIGQGLGAGLRDAANLTWKLAGVIDGTLAESVLDTYESERRPHAAETIGLAVTMGRAMTGGGRTGDRIRRVLVPLLSHAPHLRKQITDGASPRLMRGPLVLTSRRPRSLAGKLCPNPEVEPGRLLDTVTEGRFAVVTTGAAHAFPGAVAVAGNPVLTAWLRAGRASVAVVRPDGTVYSAGDQLIVPPELRDAR
jgi:3-(3-hydroxy-phenyl)propionate hydroxylase